jgi:hypothetical protein
MSIKELFKGKDEAMNIQGITSKKWYDKYLVQ